MAQDREVEEVDRELEGDDEDEGRVLSEGEGAARRPEPVSESGGSTIITLVASIASLALVLAIWSLFFSRNGFSDLRTELAAKADSAMVAQQITWLDSVVSTKADQAKLTQAVNSFTVVQGILNNRLV
ncbi:MAG: hypothetical protein AAB476_01460, partial [Patescibacteria group bacterium]